MGRGDAPLSPGGRDPAVYADDLAKTLELYVVKVDELLTSHHARQLKLWGDEQAAILRRTHDLDEQYIAVEEEIRAQYLHYLEQQQVLHDREKARLQEEQQQQLQQQDQTLQAEVRRMHIERMAFEEDLRKKFEALLASHRRAREGQLRVRLDKCLQSLTEKVEIEREKSAACAEAAAQAETKSTQRYLQQTQDLRAELGAQQQRLLRDARDRMQAQYAMTIDALQQQLDAAMGFNDNADQEWVQELQQMSAEQIQTMRSYEVQLRQKYEREIADLKAQAAEQRNADSQTLERATAQWAAEKQELLGKVRKMKIALTKWRLDYQDVAQKKAATEVARLEQKFQADTDNLQMENQQLREVIAAHESGVPPKTRLTAGPGNRPGKLEYLQGTLRKLWHALESNPQDVAEFVGRLEAVLPDSDSVVQCYEDECLLQADRLPLVQSVSRREYLRMRLERVDEEIDHDGGQLVLESSLQSPMEIEKELQTLERDLKFALQEYERKHKHQFMYGDRPYMERLLEK
jgi:hypothetical protein